ncbi:MAG: LysR family transcriptional regulator [Eisenbergiella massiliensis]
MTGAARQLFISQPNLSRDIRELEEEIGFSIFTRSSRGVIPTEKGREFLALAKGRKAVSGPGKLLHQGGTGQYQPAYLCPPRQLHHLRAHLFSQQKRQRQAAVGKL